MSQEKFIGIDTTTGLEKEFQAINTSSGAGDAAKIISTNAQGKIDVTFLPDGIGADAVSIEASEALAANDLVNVWNDGGTAKLRKANATDDSKPAHGFVKDNVTSGAQGTIFFNGFISGQSGLEPGNTVWLSASTSGAIEDDATNLQTSGNLLQTVGIAISTTQIEFERGRGVCRA